MKLAFGKNDLWNIDTEEEGLLLLQEKQWKERYFIG